MKYNNYVAIITPGENIKYVTKIDNSTRSARWEDNTKALKLSKSIAEDICFGLNMNGIYAGVFRVPDFLSVGNGNFSL